jgi:His-Xaa-Ser system protein HxsD
VSDVRYEAQDGAVTFEVHEELYPKDAIYGACYLFVDRAYVSLSRHEEMHIQVRLRGKEPLDEAALHALAGEFQNELLNQVVRQRIAERTKALREYTFARAFYGDSGSASIDAILAELDKEALADSALEIQLPWEPRGG